ncbi:2',3'-cyclic-nucleotide 2'-phosphodiesterase/3'-nucleotidase [Treponema rectale]|uniref:2',3'-cyclic-nucleotide 2'-phosphodiesterase/3'-nucleotidase n=1 Tax=Treponema rectale TaxID=744512 RepID=A0A840SH00_9SPIR|nr:5'-nucleotidase C-terminal domain-containing protein [Treponema rectale]MBB5218682.1 2',3'-cyclic-nucleotide 2'-phosphodiesterase/3'-nucleotidase [Treponema rectale]
MKKIIVGLSAALILIGLPVSAEKVTLTMLETSDIHGAISPYDYATDSVTDNGLAKVATVVKSERLKDPDLLLFDAGDCLQDNLIQEFRFEKKNPMINAMNTLKYDANVLGNHEFNFEFKTLLKEIKQFKAPVLAANIYKKDSKRFVEGWTVAEVKGVRVGIIGITAPHVPVWEASAPEHYNNMTFTSPIEEVGTALSEIEGKADIIVVVAHYGLNGEFGEHGMGDVAEKYGDRIPVFFIGHAHDVVNQTASSGALIVEPGAKGAYVAKVTVELDNESGSWKVTSKKGELLAVKGAGIEPDAEIEKLNKSTHEKSLKIAGKVVGKIKDNFLPSLWWNGLEGIPTAAVQDTAMMDLINKVQMDNATLGGKKADVSMAALFESYSNLEKGEFHKRDGVKIYKFDNTLFAVRVTGRQLKAIMEKQAGRFFNTFRAGDVTISFNENMRLYLYDMFAGVDYEIDISKPEGSRIQNVMFKGKPLNDDESLILALNNYRFGNLKSEGMFGENPEYRDTSLAVRDMISDYVAKHSPLAPECDNNWKITGYEFAPEAEQVYALVHDGKLKVPASANGRTPNVKALNVNDLRAQGLLK